MLDQLTYHRNTSGEARYTVLIPTWNNLAFLQLVVRSLRQNSTHEHQIVVFVNEGVDGTREWLAKQTDVDYILSPENAGICYALNLARSLARAPYLVYFNDDMYALPGWDERLIEVADGMPTREFMVSATMIEPYDTGNPCVSFGNYGQSVDAFEESRLLSEYSQHKKSDWSGSTWPPNLMPTELWDAVGGLSIEYHPGVYSDPDFSRKIWELGVREFRGVGDSLVYHFGRQSTSRLKHHKGREIYVRKWGIGSGTFTRHFLRLGKAYEGPLTEPVLPLALRIKDWLKVRGWIKA
ncbi:MAG: glycosyltransferase family 2 protein [Saprospiraceae bacterium]